MAGILGTGQNILNQANTAGRTATDSANSLAANNSSIKIANDNAKKSMMGTGLGAAASLGIAASSAAPAAAAAGTAATGAAVGGAAAGGAAASAGAAAAIPYVGWAAAAGILAYSLFG